MAKLRVGIHGAGWVSGEHIRAFAASGDAEVVAVCSRRIESARSRAAEAGLDDAACFTSLQKMLDSVPLDVVSICTPPDLHPGDVETVAAAGKHMVVEKAIANSPAELARVTRAVASAGVTTIVSFVLRWNPQFMWIDRMLAEGAIGEVFLGRVDYWHNIGPWAAQYAWNVRRTVAGSVWLSAGIHAVDALLHFTQAAPVEVTAYSNRRGTEYEYDTNAVGVVRFDNGAIGQLSSSFDVLSPYAFNIDLLGDRGTIRDNRIHARDFFGGQTDWIAVPTIRPDSGDVTHHPFQGQMNHFIDCVRNGAEPVTSVRHAAGAHLVCYALERSATEGRPVPLSEVASDAS